MTKFCMLVDIQDIITYETFSDDRLRGLGVVMIRISHFPIDLRRRPYNTLALPWECVTCVWCDSGTGGQNDGRKDGRICQHSIAICMHSNSDARPSQNVWGVMGHEKCLSLTCVVCLQNFDCCISYDGVLLLYCSNNIESWTLENCWTARHCIVCCN